METPYTPINCSYYDQLEAWATRRQVVPIRYQSPDMREPVTVSGVIETFFIREKAEFLQLTSGLQIRLDHLLTVNNQPAMLIC